VGYFVPCCEIPLGIFHGALKCCSLCVVLKRLESIDGQNDRDSSTVARQDDGPARLTGLANDVTRTRLQIRERAKILTDF
jgi:hypothetical protein